MTVPLSPEVMMRRLIERHQVGRVEIVTMDGRTFAAIAYPALWSPIVDARRHAALAAAGKASFTIAEVQEISDRAVNEALARGAAANTVAEAIRALWAAITQPAAADGDHR